MNNIKKSEMPNLSRKMSTYNHNVRNFVERSFTLKILIKISLFAAILHVIDAVLRDGSFQANLDHSKLFFLIPPLIEIMFPILAIFLPPPLTKIGRPEQNILGPFLCRPTPTSMGFWMAFWDDVNEVAIKVSDGKGLVEKVDLKRHSNRFNTWIGQTKNKLSPETTYEYEVTYDGKNWAPSWLTDFKFQTQSGDVNKESQFFTMSCHGIDTWTEKKSADTAFKMWDELYLKIHTGSVSLGLLGGDQVYMDSQFEEKIRKFERYPVAERTQLIKEVYFKYWSHPSYQRVLARVPCMLMWDDHDINDGYGSRPDSFSFPQTTEIKSSWNEYMRDLTSAFEAFQGVRNPQSDQFKPNFSFVFEGPNFNIAAFDLRSERNVRLSRMMSDKTMETLADKIRYLDGKPLFLLSPVTVTRISAGIENFLGKFANTVWRYTRFFGYGQAFKKVLFWFLAFSISFVSLQAETEVTSIFLSSSILILAGTYILVANTYSALTGDKSEIQGKAQSWFIIGSIIGIAAGIFGLTQSVSILHSPFVNAAEQLITQIKKDQHNLTWLFGCLIVSIVTLFDVNRIENDVFRKIIKAVFGYLSLCIFIIVLLWYGLPDSDFTWWMLIKVPVSILSLFFLMTTILESMGVVDEISGLDDDIKDSWSSKPNEESLAWLFDTILKCKQQVYLLCGDIHTGGLSNIWLDNNKVIPQITSSPISYTPMPAIAEKFTTDSDPIPLDRKTKDGKIIPAKANNVFFLSERNFAILAVKGSRVSVEFIFENHKKSVKIVLNE